MALTHALLFRSTAQRKSRKVAIPIIARLYDETGAKYQGC
jgi:hypothetical protein